MKVQYKLMLLIIFALGCGEVKVRKKCTTPRSSQQGQFDMIFTEVEGNCGSIDDLVVNLELGVIQPNASLGCTTPNITWYKNQCKTTSVFNCDDGSWKTKMVWTIESDFQNPDRLHGVLSTQLTRWSGVYSCNSVYQIEASRLSE